MKADVFISYRGADRALARKLEQRLRSRWGSRVFRDETGLVAGDSWADGLRIALERASVVVALVGRGWALRDEAAEPDWVRRELMDAIERGTPVLPVLIGASGDVDALRAKLSTLPDAFSRQAVVVGDDIPLNDVLEVVKRLRQLGAFADAPPTGLGAGRADLVSPRAVAKVLEALDARRSVLVQGVTGSGRTALLRRIARERSRPQHFVAVCGLEPGEVSRSTHAVMGALFTSLCRAIVQEPSSRDAQRYGHALLDAILACGPDLLSRKVLPVSVLLPLGNDRHDHEVLRAARRPTDRWAPYPPRRLVIQARAVLERFVEVAEVSLDLIVADVDATDASSRDLIADLLRTRLPIQLVLAATPTAAAPAGDDDVVPNHPGLALLPAETVGRLLPSTRRLPLRRRLAGVDIDTGAMWGESASPLPTWLEAHRVTIDPSLLAQLGEPNPYYALCHLWYLADRGFVAEQDADDDGGLTAWVLAGAARDVPRPDRPALLDHMLDEYIPLDLRRILEVGALVGRSFPLDVVAEACAAEAPDAGVEAGAGGSDPRAHADRLWERLVGTDPDNVVLTCHDHRDGARFVTFALDDFVPHIAAGLAARAARRYRLRLAEAFAAAARDTEPDDIDGTFRGVSAAAEHWEAAGEVRRAADAHRHAAELAERALAYREAERHYRVAIRLLSQLIAEEDATHDHEDLLIVANCLYRLGQMVRLSEEFTDDETGSPQEYFRFALERLSELRARLLKQDFAANPALTSSSFARDIPGPDKARHLLRTSDALSGYITLDLATWLEGSDRERARLHLFDTLRFAEEAAGEANSRWLLAAASARLAESLANEAIEESARAAPDRSRAQALAGEALFHVERVVGLRPVNPDEELDLTEPKAWSRAVFGRLLTELHCEPRLAEWVFRKLNKHRDDVRVAVDMATDFRLGQFLLSLVTLPTGAETTAERRRLDAPLVEARELLERHARWARESGLRASLGPALSRLALAEILRAGARRSGAARTHLEQALADSSDADRREAFLILGLLAALAPVDAVDETPAVAGTAGSILFEPDDDPLPTRPAPDTTLAAFRSALGLDDEVAPDDPRPAGADGDDRVLRDGWRAASLLLLRVCPTLGLLALDRAGAVLAPTDVEADPELSRAREHAVRYLERVAADPPMSPMHDRLIERLVMARSPGHVAMTKARALSQADELFQIHRAACVAGDTADADVLQRDLHWATLVHDWYGEVEPARLLVLASEWHQTVSGLGWASPRLLRGPLAVAALRDQFDAEAELGTERFGRIARLIEQGNVGSYEATPLEMVFFLAHELIVRPAPPTPPQGPAGAEGWRAIVTTPGRLTEAYHLALGERVASVRALGRPLDERSLPPSDASSVTPVTAVTTVTSVTSVRA